MSAEPMKRPGKPDPDPVVEVERAHQAWLDRPAGTVEDLLRHLRRAVPFYRHRTGTTLDELPVVERSSYGADGAAFRRDGSHPPYDLSSSGSTGEPLTIGLDAPSWYAVNYHFFTQVARLAGMSAADFARGQVAVLFVSNKPGRPSFVRPLPGLGNALYVRLQLADPATTATLYERLGAAVLYGKPTYLLDLRSALLRHGLSRPPCHPRLVLVSGEPLHPDDRDRLRGFFGAPVVDALASTEGGLVAVTRPDTEEYEVLAENVRLEVLLDDGSVADSGEGELLVTNLVYRDTVFARYRSGDRAELRTSGSRQRLARLWGRDPRTVVLGTRRVSRDVLADRLGRLPGIGDFQVVSGSEPPVIRWTPDARDGDAPGLQRRLQEAVRALLPGQEIVLERSDRITPPGGKKRRFA